MVGTERREPAASPWAGRTAAAPDDGRARAELIASGTVEGPPGRGREVHLTLTVLVTGRALRVCLRPYGRPERCALLCPSHPLAAVYVEALGLAPPVPARLTTARAPAGD